MGQHRANLAERRAESWRPPPLEPAQTARQRIAMRLRRFFDLQAGSVWADLMPLLRSARGKVVDVGCGAQPYRELLPPGIEYVGLDIIDAKERFGYGRPDTLYFDGKHWPTGARGADLVLCTVSFR